MPPLRFTARFAAPLGVVVALMSSARTATGAEASLCQPTEQIVFSCKVEKDKSLVSVCISGDRVYFREGTKKKLENQFPEELGPASKFFERETTTDAAGTHWSLYFVTDASPALLKYHGSGSIYVTEDQLEKKPSVGSVSYPGEEGGLTYSCAGTPQSNWALLNGIVPTQAEAARAEAAAQAQSHPANTMRVVVDKDFVLKPNQSHAQFVNLDTARTVAIQLSGVRDTAKGFTVRVVPAKAYEDAKTEGKREAVEALNAYFHQLSDGFDSTKEYPAGKWAVIVTNTQNLLKSATVHMRVVVNPSAK